MRNRRATHGFGSWCGLLLLPLIGGVTTVNAELRRDYALGSEPDDLNRIAGALNLEFFYQILE